MFGISNTKWKWIFAFLIVANIVYYVFGNWGLITVKVSDAPLSKVISSIEWQGWVKIYSNLPPDAKVSMYVDHVPLAEAMETLAANVDVPPPPDSGDGAPRPDGQPVGAGGGPPGGAPPFGGGGPPGDGAPGGPRGGRGGGFGGRAAQWNLAFFVAPTSAQVKEEIRAFQAGDPDTDAKVYTYGTPLQFVSTDDTAVAADPRLQSWPGVKPVDPASAPAPVDTQTNAPTGTQTASDPPDDVAAGPPTVQTYLEALAQSANIWIMAPGSWTPAVANPPPPDSSIIAAVKKLVGGSQGAVTQALILRAGRGGPPRTGTNRDFAANDDAWADRMQNAINGLPADERPEALEQLKQEVQFRKDVRALPPEQRRQKFFQHAMERMIYGERLSRLSPEKRAQVYQRMLAMRAAAKAAK